MIYLRAAGRKDWAHAKAQRREGRVVNNLVSNILPTPLRAFAPSREPFSFFVGRIMSVLELPSTREESWRWG
ncbi:hypothetical protein [Sphingomonas sp. Ant20]|uniref:hypothetical protein n=1 Tax=Sphingomonas sp. Ant20 TaxID=104605 RepID=UPI000FE14575|nr:hypothetical protein [Sphingomonas sp. Ant20]